VVATDRLKLIISVHVPVHLLFFFFEVSLHEPFKEFARGLQHHLSRGVLPVVDGWYHGYSRSKLQTFHRRPASINHLWYPSDRSRSDFEAEMVEG
jgi:hypothetical protein